MSNRYMDGDAAAEMLERRWFAMYKRTEEMRAECEAMREALEKSQAAWMQAQSKLSEYESMRDALGEEVAALAERDFVEQVTTDRRIRSAA